MEYSNPSRKPIVWRKVEKPFTLTVAGSIVHGDPKHPNHHGRYVQVTEEQADILAAQGYIAKKNSPAPSANQADDEYDIDEGEEEGLDGGTTGTSTENEDGAAPVDGRASAQAVREKRVAGEPAGRQQQRRGRATRTGKTSAPAGGRSTTATTNHPTGENQPNTDGADADGEEGDEAPRGGGAG